MNLAKLTTLSGINHACLAAAGLFGLWPAVQPSAATAQITLSVGNATGPQGGTATITATLASGGQAVIGTDLIMQFDPTVLNIDPSTCTLAADLAAGNTFLLVAHFQPPTAENLVLITVTENPHNPQPAPIPIRDGDLFTCTFTIAASAPLGSTPLTVTLAHGACPNPQPPPQVTSCPGVSGSSGSVTVGLAPPTSTPLPTATPTPTNACTNSSDCGGDLRRTCVAHQCECAGDCNGDGLILSNEVSLLVSILRGTDPVSACPSVDINGDQLILSDEVSLILINLREGCPAATPAT